jgi:hypothetical protein
MTCTAEATQHAFFVEQKAHVCEELINSLSGTETQGAKPPTNFSFLHINGPQNLSYHYFNLFIMFQF